MFLLCLKNTYGPSVHMYASNGYRAKGKVLAGCAVELETA